MMLSQRVHHFAVAVSDLAAARAWYEEKLDFVLEKHFTLEDAGVEIMKLVNASGIRLELLRSLRRPTRVKAEQGVVTPGMMHLCFDGTDIEAAAAECRRRGIEIVQPPRFIPESQEKNCWFVDGEGNWIEMIERVG